MKDELIMPRVDPIHIERMIRVSFTDQELLERSLTHPSYLNEHPSAYRVDNQRLEFLGDAVLSFISGEWLYDRFPEQSEGYLTRLRASLVRTEQLAGFARQIRLGDSLRLGKGEDENGGRNRDGNLCAAFEALIGAVYLDRGMEIARGFVLPFLAPALDEVLRLELDRDAKSALQEWCQAHLGVTPQYQTVSAEGPDHAKQFTVAVFVKGHKCADGIGPNKQTAAQLAAQRALAILQTPQLYDSNLDHGG